MPPQLDNRALKKIIAWAQGLTRAQLTQVDSLSLRRDMVTFVNYIKDKRPVGTQSTGNLQLKAVREVCAQFVNPPVLDEKIGDRIYKLRSEEDAWQLFYIHMLANTGGLVSGGQARVWKITPEGEAFMNFTAPTQLGFMLSIWWYMEDWRIAFPVSGLSQGLPSNFKKVSLARLLELPTGKSSPFKTFANRLIEETHMTWPSLDQTNVNDIMRSAIKRMVILPLVEFGIMESEYGTEDIGGHQFSKLSKILLTSFGKGLLETL